jgi:hypothetical protein
MDMFGWKMEKPESNTSCQYHTPETRRKDHRTVNTVWDRWIRRIGGCVRRGLGVLEAAVVIRLIGRRWLLMLLESCHIVGHAFIGVGHPSLAKCLNGSLEA